jgi:hypothetical protein
VTKFRTGAVVFGWFASLSVFSCTENIEVGRNHASGAGSGGTASNTGGATASASGSGGMASPTCQQATCQGKLYDCGDCSDNDGDGLIDSEDPECTGPCDNTEDSYYGGIPGQNNAPCRQDCYFDSNTGAGDDQCYWSHTCDSYSVAPEFPPSGDSHCAYDPNANIPGTNSSCEESSNAQDSACLDTCLPITPNGCDCFGCCELPADSGKYVWIGSTSQNVGTCDAAHVDDPVACRPCTPVPSCFNACDPCEVCVGRTAPANCGSNGPLRCPGAAAACGQPGEPACDPGYYCITGCCAAAPR